MPQAEELATYYGTDAYRRDVLDSNDLGHVRSDEVREIDRDSVRRRLGAWLRHIRPAARHLDVGSWWGGVLEEIAAARRIEESIGVEPGPAGRAYGAIRDIADVRGAFDLVTCFNVLEHVRDPMAFLRRIRELASGQVCVALPLPGRREWPHLYDFTPRAAQMAMGQAGLPAMLVGMSTELMLLHDPQLHRGQPA